MLVDLQFADGAAMQGWFIPIFYRASLADEDVLQVKRRYLAPLHLERVKGFELTPPGKVVLYPELHPHLQMLRCYNRAI